MRLSRWIALLALVLVGGCNDQSCSNKKLNLALPVLTQHNNGNRSGVQLETMLNPSNVAPGKFGKLFTRALPASPNSTGLLKDRIYTQPLVVDNISPALVIVATDTNMVYAFDAENAGAAAPVWKADLGPPESAMDNWPDAHCNRSLPVIGVLGTPVITPDEKWLYVVSKNRKGDVQSKDVSFTIHKLSVSDGTEVKSAPLTAGGFNPYHQLQRPGLAWVSNEKAPGGGYIYAAFGGHCDAGVDYHGWVFGFDGELNQIVSQTTPFNTTPASSGAGIWQAGQAPASVSEGCPDHCQDVLYVATGNATGNTAAGNGQGQFANTVLKLGWKPTEASPLPTRSGRTTGG